MISTDYRLDPNWNHKLREVNLATADESTISYELFLGDVFLVINGVDLSAPWGWVPIIDFARSLYLVIEDLKNQPSAGFEFTESDAKLSFERDNDSVRVSANYGGGSVNVPVEELLEAARSFAKRVFRELGSAYPQLQQNPGFNSYQSEINSG